MRRPALIILLLLTAAFALATRLAPSLTPPSARSQDKGLFELLLGGGRQLFAEHLFTKADVYMHAGYYPSIFDRKKLHEGKGIAGAKEEEKGDIFGPPRDWLDAFSRNFFPSKHTHLGEGSSVGDQREILPWLRLSASLDPHRVESYTVAAYFLVAHLKSPDQAEAFLREGWRANPDSYEILLELGRVMEEHRHDPARARNLWELALKKWDQRNAGQAEPDTPARAQLLGHLARLEERAGNYARALEHLAALKPLSPAPQAIQFQMDELRRKLP
jgi:tetratricopeptide (TPR) repeat protein